MKHFTAFLYFECNFFGFCLGKNNYGESKLTQDDITKNYSRLSIQYNNADEDIGDYIMFLMAEMTVSPVNSVN